MSTAAMAVCCRLPERRTGGTGTNKSQIKRDHACEHRVITDKKNQALADMGSFFCFSGFRLSPLSSSINISQKERRR
jgi:hypothetical protein